MSVDQTLAETPSSTETPASASLGLADFSQVEMLGARYISVNLAATVVNTEG